VIIGGGVVGAAIAFHLTELGLRDVLILERDRAGSGSTGRNAGGIRMQFSSEINVRLSLLSVPEIENFADITGVDPSFHQVGYLFLVTTASDAAAFERSLALWQRLAVPARRLTAEETRALLPQLDVSDVRFATFCARDGYADPSSLLRGYLGRARERGARVAEGALVDAIEVSGSRVRAVRAGGQSVACETVVDAAGAWAADVGRLAGVTIPVTPHRRTIFVTERFDGLPARFPMVIEFATGFYFHRESGGVLMGMPPAQEVDGFREDVDWEVLPRVVERALARAPVLEQAHIKTAWAGLYEDTPDAHPIVGAVGEPAGFIAACGFSGHGVMHAPGVGRLVSELICGKTTSLDLSPLALARFRDGQIVREHNVI
jgi:sarcosine oxidase subunit beta